jgi:tricorn protease
MSLRTYFSVAFFLVCWSLLAQEAPLWLRYPAISPDGQSIVFAYQGDLYQVATAGGTAVPLTLHEGRDFMPVWSRDGQQIAFASERYGNYDVFVMPAAGGTATRLTFHSANDYPTDFTPDGKRVLFSSSRLDDASNQQFPSGVLSELYQVSTNGGTPTRVLTTPAEMARYSPDGNRLVFHDRKGYEDEFRKHHQSSVTRDVWSYDFATGQYQQLTSFAGEDRNPVFVPGENAVYYLSESTGTFNIHRMELEDGASESQAVTQLEKHPVRQLSVSNGGLLCFSWDGELYTLRPGEEPRKVEVRILTDQRNNPSEILKVNKGIAEYEVSPNGKEIVFVHRGEVFVSSVSKGTTKRITHTPTQERSVSFSPDGRSILYAGERDGSWNVYQTSLAREEEKYFFSSTLLKEEVVIATEKEEFQPAYSPDGKEVAYLEERTALKVVNLESKENRLIVPGDRNYSYSDGDQHYQWSPDGKWFLVEFLQPQQWIGQAGLVSASGNGEIVNLTRSGYGDYAPRWMMEGKMMVWFSDRDGMKNDASWGGQADVYGMFFTQETYDRFKLSKEELEILKEEEKEESEEEGKDKDKEKTEEEKEKIEPLKIELEDIEDRKVRLTIHSSDLGDAWVSKDGEHLYYLAKFEKGYDLWKTELRTRDTKILTKLGANSAGGLIPDKKGENLFLLADGLVHKISLGDGSKESVGISGEMVLDESAERSYLFEHAWRQVEKKFYLTDLHEVEWDFYKTAYARFLPHINNNYDFAEMLSELLGELNASHTGARYWKSDDTGDRTAALGVFFDDNYEGPGRKVAEVMEKGPLDKSDSKVDAGVVIEKIDGVDLDEEANYFALLNRKTGKNTLLSLFNPATKERWEEVIQPISLGAENELRYQRWVENCRQIVEEASGGTIGYVHVRGMNDRSFRVVYEEALGRNANKKALVVDTRFNGGGWLHDDLVTFLNGEKYMTFMPRGQNLGNEPQFKWTKPSIVVMSESNYSDAHMFPYAYKALGVGKLVGAPVPGTGTAVWWERLQNGMVFGIPQVGMVTNDGEYLENTQLEPDVKVLTDPNLVIKGKDPQLEAAVKELEKVIKP